MIAAVLLGVPSFQGGPLSQRIGPPPPASSLLPSALAGFQGAKRALVYRVLVLLAPPLSSESLLLPNVLRAAGPYELPLTLAREPSSWEVGNFVRSEGSDFVPDRLLNVQNAKGWTSVLIDSRRRTLSIPGDDLNPLGVALEERGPTKPRLPDFLLRLERIVD